MLVHIGDQRGGRKKADAGYLAQAAYRLAVTRQLGELLFDGLNAVIQLP